MSRSANEHRGNMRKIKRLKKKDKEKQMFGKSGLSLVKLYG